MNFALKHAMEPSQTLARRRRAKRESKADPYKKFRQAKLRVVQRLKGEALNKFLMQFSRDTGKEMMERLRDNWTASHDGDLKKLPFDTEAKLALFLRHETMLDERTWEEVAEIMSMRPKDVRYLESRAVILLHSKNEPVT